jgi:hypothetical protein
MTFDKYIEHVSLDDGEIQYDIEWTPKYYWHFDHYVGVGRAQELGLWKSSTDPNRTWTVEGSIVVWDSNYEGAKLVVEADEHVYTIEAYIDQWGTYYTSTGTLYVASEAGKRSFWTAYLEAIEKFRGLTEFEMKEPFRSSTEE